MNFKNNRFKMKTTISNNFVGFTPLTKTHFSLDELIIPCARYFAVILDYKTLRSQNFQREYKSRYINKKVFSYQKNLYFTSMHICTVVS